MRASRLLSALVCGLLALLVIGCPKKQPEDPNAELLAAAKKRQEERKAGPSEQKTGEAKAAKAEPRKAAEADEEAEAVAVSEAPTDSEPEAPGADAEPPTPEPAEDEGADTETEEGDEAEAPEATNALEVAWGARGKARPSQAGEDEVAQREALRIVSGPSYARKSADEVDKLRAEEQSQDLPPSELFGMITIRTPFRKIDRKPPERGPHPWLMDTLIDERVADSGQRPSEPTGPTEQPTRVETADGQPEQPTQPGSQPRATAEAPEWTTEPLTVPPTGTGVAQALPGQIQGPIIVPQQGPQLTQQQLAELQRQAEVNAFFSQRFAPSQRGATRPAPPGSLNLHVAGTVVGNDGRATAVLSDGTNSVWVKEGDQFTFEGRNLRVVRVAQGFVQVEDRQRRINLGVGGSSP